MEPTHDVAIIGAGIVGLATGLALLEKTPGLDLVFLEKEEGPGRHQTGRNSGVIHSGVYYKPGSQKARLCVEGVEALVRFCDEEGVTYDRMGKVIVAVDRTEVPALEELHRRSLANGVPGVRMIGPAELADLEPHAAGVAALHVPGTGSVDYLEVAAAMGRRLERMGARVRTGSEVTAIRRDGSEDVITTSSGEVRARMLVNCAGLYSDRIARMAGVDPGVQIVPFRGEYYTLRPGSRSLVRGLLYPVPDPRFPFLGVHFTRRVNGEVEAGPNAVLAFAREGYRKSTIKPRELWETLSYPGFRKVARKFWRMGAGEMYRSYSKRAFVKALQRLVPDVQGADLAPGGSGIRAQAVGVDGALLDDFAIRQAAGAVHVLNAPSPAATASLTIGRYIASLVGDPRDAAR